MSAILTTYQGKIYWPEARLFSWACSLVEG